MPVRVDIPTRLKLDVPALTERRDDIGEAVAAAVGRALRSSVTEVLEPRGGYVGVKLNEPELSWWGDGLAAVPPTVRAEVEEAVRDAVASAAADTGLPRPAGEGASTPLQGAPAVPIDDPRYDPFFGLYELPVYDAAGKKTKVPVRRPAAKDHPGFTDPIFQWYPLTSREALAVYLRAAQGANQPPAQGYQGAIYLDRQRGMTIDVVEYPSGEHVFRASGLRLVELVDDGVSRDMVLTPVKTLPPVSRYLIDYIGTRDSPEFERGARAVFEEQVRFFMHARKSHVASAEEFTKELESRLHAYVKQAKAEKDVNEQTVFMRLRVHVASFLLILQPYGEKGQPKPDMKRVRLLPLVRPAEPGGEGGKGRGGAGRGQGPAGEGRGTEGEGAEPGEAPGGPGEGVGGEGARRGGVEGGIAGGKPSKGPPAFVDIGGGPTAGSLFPPASAEMERMELVCEAYLGEPSMGELGADGNRMRNKMEHIAYRLQIPTCEYAGKFLLNAAEALGGRATQVALWEVTDTGGMKATPEGGGNLGAVQFIATAGPQILFLRHLATTVPLMTDLKRDIDRVYRERSDLIQGIWHRRPESWMNRWHHAYVVDGMERHVGLMFVMTCNVIFKQLLNTSRVNIEQRSNDWWTEKFVTAILPHLMYVDELMRARELLDDAEDIAYLLQYGPQGLRHRYHDVRVQGWVEAFVERATQPANWKEAAEAVTAAVTPAPATVPKEVAPKYELVPVGDGYRIRDKRGRLWDLESLDLAIAMRRGTIEEVEPLVKQFTDLPEVVERLRDLPDGGRKYELHLLLKEMRESNEEITQKAKDSAWFGFRATRIHEDVRNATVARTNYQLQGIHQQAHQQIQEFFRGDPFYGLGIEALFAAELGRKELMMALEISATVLCSVIFPPMGVIAGFHHAMRHRAEAKEREAIYKSLIDPEIVLRAAEVEAELFAANLGLVLSLVPAPGGLRAFQRAPVRVLGKEGATAVRTLSAVELYLDDLMSAGIVRTFTKELAEEWLEDQVMNFALQPLMSHLQREWDAGAPVGGVQGAMNRILAQAARRRDARAGVTPVHAGGP